MTTVPRRRAARAALALGFLYIAASAHSQVIVNNTTLPVTPGSNPPSTFYELQNGTLQDQSGGAYGNGILIDPNFNGVIDAHSNNTIWNGVISGTGNLLTLSDSVGGGMITLNGANTYAGVTAINGSASNMKVGVGNVSAFGLGSLSLNGATLLIQSVFATPILNNMQLVGASNILDINGNATTFSGSLFGTGGVTFQNSGGAAMITLTGTSYYTGQTVVAANLLVGLANSGFGAGPVTLGGNNTLELVGAANLPNPIAMLGNTTIDAHGQTGTFSGPISGAGSSLTIVDGIGGGVVALSGAGGSWSGGTFVDAGTLQMGAAGVMPSAGALTINGGTFDMNGWAQTMGSVTNNAALKTGAASLTVTGNYAAGAASLLGVTPFVGEPNLIVGGTANITAGASLTVNGKPASGYYEIVQTNAPIAQQYAFIAPGFGYNDTVSYIGDDIFLKVIAPSYVAAGQTPNQMNLASAFNSQTANVSPDMALVLTTLNTLTGPQLSAAMDQISPIGYSAIGGAALTGAGLNAAAIGRRIDALESGIASAGGRVDRYTVSGPSPYPGTLVAEGGGGPVPAAELEQEKDDSNWGLFFSGLDTIARQDGREGAAGFQPGYSFVSYGGALGFDYRIADGFAAGLTGGYLQGSTTIDDGVGKLTSESFRFGAYAAAWDEALHGSLYLGGALDSYNTTRDIPTFARAATASPAGGEFDMKGSLGYDLKSGATTLSPFGSLDIDRVSVAGFTESGAGALDMNVGPQTDDSVRTTLGAKFAHRFGFDENWFGLTPALSAAWEHEFANQSRAISAQFATGGASFAVGTADVAREALLGSAGFAMEFGKDATLRFGYSVDVRSDFMARTIDANLRFRF